MVHRITHRTAWRAYAPWPDDSQVERTLVLSRAALELFADNDLAGKIAMRGGTSLHKLFLHPPYRYSEDIDLDREAAAVHFLRDVDMGV